MFIWYEIRQEPGCSYSCEETCQENLLFSPVLTAVCTLGTCHSCHMLISRYFQSSWFKQIALTFRDIMSEQGPRRYFSVPMNF